MEHYIRFNLNSVNLDVNESHSEEERSESLTSRQQTLRRKRHFSRIYTFHICDPKSKRRKKDFVAGISNNASQAIDWKARFKKKNEQLKNDASLQVSNVDPNKPCKSKGNLDHYSVADIAEKLDTNEELMTIENPNLEIVSNCETDLLSENDAGYEDSVNSDLNKSHSEEEKSDWLTRVQQTWRRKRRLNRIYTFHINNPKSKQLKSDFAARVSNNAYQTSQWNTKFKKINDQLKNDASLQVSNVDPNKPCKSKGNLDHYSVANMAEKLDTNEKLITIENPELEIDSDCETQKEACASKDTLTESKSIKCSGKKVIAGNYITYIKSKNVNLDKSNKKKRKRTVKRRREKHYDNQDQIKEFFQNFSKREFSHLNFKPSVQMLVNKLKSPRFFASSSEKLFHILTYLLTSKKDPLLSYCINEDSAVQIPLDENCIVTALLSFESKHLRHSESILRRAITTIHHLILSKKKFTMLSLGSLCRVLVEICKRQGNSLKPVILCADLLKMRHPFATYLIASIAVVWKELFKIEENLPAEEVLFHSSILYGACKSIKHLTNSCRDICLKIITSYFTAPLVQCAKSAIPIMKHLIEMRCQDDTWNSQYLTSALVILARHEDWDWVQDNLLTNFIVPNLNKFGRETLNEHAFDVFCNLYVDVFLLKPGNPLDITLSNFVNNSESIEGENFVKDCAALALIRFVYLKNRQLPSFLDSWFEENKQKPKVQQIESIFRRKKMGEDLKSLRLEDIL